MLEHIPHIVDVLFYTELGPISIPIPDRFIDRSMLFKRVIAASGDEDGLAVVFLHLVFVTGKFGIAKIRKKIQKLAFFNKTEYFSIEVFHSLSLG